MKKTAKLLFLGLFLSLSGATFATGSQTVVFKNNQSAYSGSSEFFTGDVKVLPMTDADSANNYTTGYVTFSAGARSAWHTHPAGQTLVVISGTCWTQTENGEKTEAQVGDIIWCPPEVKHWHGASPNGEMTHLAITGMKDGNNVTWLEKVTDEEYMSK